MKPLFSPQIHRNIYFALLAFLGGCMVCANGPASVTWVLMLANWLLEGRWREKWELFKQSRLLQAILFFFLFHVLALLWTSNLDQGILWTNRALPFTVVSLILLTSPLPQGKTRSSILAVYMGTVLVVSVIGLVRWLAIPDLPYREIVPYISNIRFSLNCCMVVILLILAGNEIPQKWWSQALRILAILWMLFFMLLLLRSYTGLAILLCVSPILIVRCHRPKLFILWGAVVLAIVLVVVAECRSYYRLSPLAQEPLKACTLNGRPYTHKQDGLIENGNYVNNYICSEELRTEWSRRTGTDISSPTASGFTVEPVLIRYLNALGLTKDSLGISSLNDSQIAEISRGIANPVYIHGSLPRRMIYVSLFEYENYRCYRAVDGFSMLQRLELWKCAWKVFLQHPIFGTGTGDMLDQMHLQHIADGSPLQNRILRPHNEYLTLLCMFGLLGFLSIAAMFLRAACQPLKHSSIQAFKQSTLMLVWCTVILLSCLTENTPCSLAGGLFCSWFLAFRE